MKNSIKLAHPAFVDIDGAYGFDQGAMANRWSRYLLKRSCGLAALANLISYGKGERRLNKEEAMHRLNTLLTYAPPRPWGIACAGIFKRAVERMGLPFRVEILSGRIGSQAAYPFIVRHLEADRPVALLNTNHPRRGFHNHWVSLTEIRETEDGIEAVFSSWGKRYRMDYETLLSDKTLYRALVALVPKEQKERV